MKIRVIQENNIVIITLLSLSEKIVSKFKRRRSIKLARLNDNSLDIILYKKKYIHGIIVTSLSVGVGINSIGSSESYGFADIEAADKFVAKLKKSINLINHGIEEESIKNNSTFRETTIEILE